MMMNKERKAQVMQRREEVEDGEIRGGGGGGNTSNATNSKRRRIEEMGQREEFSDFKLALGAIDSSSLTNSSGISTAAFISISELLLLVLDKIGPAMVVLRQDVKHNIERLEGVLEVNPTLYSNLLEILRKETEEGTTKKPQSCSRAIVWLTRSINFGANLMRRLMKDPKLTLELAVEEAYDVTFKPWHGWISAAAYRVALKLLPDRMDFMNMLLEKKQEENLFEKDLDDLFSLFQPVLDEIDERLREYKLEKLKSH